MGDEERGNKADYILGTREGWAAFKVIRWHGVEEISGPFRYEITLLRATDTGPADLDELIDSGASFRIASRGVFRVVHGIIAEAAEVDRTEKAYVYRVVLAPHLVRARYRRRCRNFVDQTLKDILTAVIENRSQVNPRGKGGLVAWTGSPKAEGASPSFASFSEPTAFYRWAVADESRITDATTSPYIVQLNESDFDFASRLLEAEGLSYWFEHSSEGSVMTIADDAGRSQLFPEPETFTLRRVSRGAHDGAQEVVRSLRAVRRIETRSVTMRDYDYHRSLSPLEATESDGGDPELDGVFEFPAGEELVATSPAKHAARIRLERHGVLRALREGMSSVRTMIAGTRFKLHDGDGLVADEELIAVRVETYATELAVEGTLLDEEPFGFAGAVGAPKPGYQSRFLAIAGDVPFRPPMDTTKPRIHGVQTAIVTAEEHDGDRPKINADDLGRVRVRFPWDQRTDARDRTPTSTWIRVSQYWAGQGYGALYTPRVGHEVLVAFLQGDPDRPVIVGRVYNVQSPPPYNPAQAPTKSTIKSQSATGTKEVDGFNEIRFEDQAKKEEIYLHAQRDLNEIVLANHTTNVGGDQTNKVQGNQTNTVGGHRDHEVEQEERVTIRGDRTTLFKADESHTVKGSRTTLIETNEDYHVIGARKKQVDSGETIVVTASRDATIGPTDKLHVKGNLDTKIDTTEKRHVEGTRTTTIKSEEHLDVTGLRHTSIGEDDFLHAKSRTIDVTNDHKAQVGGSMTLEITSDYTLTSTLASLNGGSAFVKIKKGSVEIDSGGGATISLDGATITLTATTINLTSPTVNADATAIKLVGQSTVNAEGATVTIKGGTINLDPK